MSTPKPQIRSAFATPLCIHYLPVAAEVNAELRPLILETLEKRGERRANGWCSSADFESWGKLGAQTLFRMLRELGDSMTSTRTGGRVTLQWVSRAWAEVRQKGEAVAPAARPGAFWAGLYVVDDGYGKSDDETLGGECEVMDPRGALSGYFPADLAFRIPGGGTAGMSEVLRPKSGMILMHPGWMVRAERTFSGPGQRMTIEFELALPHQS
ncbi:MAG: hypothetical protein JO208_09625 [Alphaproteobacteria bacterium]|nr:hypothetical protein [Alphaproteobacteria bacterium]